MKQDRFELIFIIGNLLPSDPYLETNNIRQDSSDEN